MEWASQNAPSLDDFEALARSQFAALPGEFRALTGNIAFVIEDFPDETVMRDLDLVSEFEILGLFQGPDLAQREANQTLGEATLIILYRRPILDYWAEHHETLANIVRHVLVHEIGHHFGLSDEDMEAIDAAAN